ncbi:MAG: hypothetical protein M1816_002168 [Peltula sp. TS41687]|nr:MAG: hypothetical protein M1816_002168 [Peltula sp. TS41687]
MATEFWADSDDDISNANTTDGDLGDEDGMMTIPAWFHKVDHLSPEMSKVALTYAAALLERLREKLPVGDPGKGRLQVAIESLTCDGSSPRKRRMNQDKSYRGTTQRTKKARVQTPAQVTRRQRRSGSSRPAPNPSGTTHSTTAPGISGDANDSSEQGNTSRTRRVPTPRPGGMSTFSDFPRRHGQTVNSEDEWGNREDEPLASTELHAGGELVTSEDIEAAGVEGGDDRMVLCLQIQQDLAQWFGPGIGSEDPLASFAVILEDNGDTAIRASITDMTPGDMREIIRRMESNTSRALFQERLALIQLGAWVERQVENMAANNLTPREALGKATDLLLEGMAIVPSNVTKARKQWLRRIRTGTRWKQLYGHFDAGILMIPHSQMGISTLGDMADESFKQALSDFQNDDRFKSMVRHITKCVKGYLSSGSDKERHLELLRRMDVDDDDAEMV